MVIWLQCPINYVEQFREQKSLFAGVAAFQTGIPFNTTFQRDNSAKPQRVLGQLVSADYSVRVFANIGNKREELFREMGIAFTQIEDSDQRTLEKWIDELRDRIDVRVVPTAIPHENIKAKGSSV